MSSELAIRRRSADRPIGGADGRTLIIQFRGVFGAAAQSTPPASDALARRGHGAGRRDVGQHDRTLARRAGPSTGSPLRWFVGVSRTSVPAGAGKCYESTTAGAW